MSTKMSERDWELVMARPEGVAGAIITDENGNVRGRYKEFDLLPAYQPIYGFDTADNEWKLTGFEGLIRPHLDGQCVAVCDFFKEVDEDDCLFVEFMCTALHIRGYKTAMPQEKMLFINIDVSKFSSVDELETEVFYLFSQLPKNNLKRELVVFEILESEILENQVLLRICEMFRSNGFRFALDDFGTKHSNIERFLLIKPDIVKLDRSIFQNFCTVRETELLIRALIGAFRIAGSQILMEGLENEEEVSMAADMKVDMMQGFGLARPMLLPATFDSNVKVQKMRRETGLHLVKHKGQAAFG